MLWLQEVGDWSIVPGDIMRGETDKLGAISLGAFNHHGVFQGSHTIALWWPPQQFKRPTHHLLEKITGLLRPGSKRGAVVWTTNPNHVVRIEDPLLVDVYPTEEVLGDLHLLHALTEFGISWSEYSILRMNTKAMLEDSLNPHIARYLPSLKKADIYRFYSEAIK